MTIRTVLVRLEDGSTVSVPEPKWCLGQHEDGLHLGDLMHDGPEIALTVPTRHGRVEILNASLAQNPYSATAEDRAPRVTVLLSEGWESFTPAGVLDLADSLAGYADRLRDLAAELARLLAEEAR